MMQPNAGQQPRQNPKPGSSLFLSQHHPQIQLPMLGPNLQVQQNKMQNQQLGPQQQQGPQPSEIPAPPQSGQDFTLSSVLHFLQTEWRRYERDRNEWEIERAEMRVRAVYARLRSRLGVQHVLSIRHV
jgi:striatin 1/3/4